MILPHRIPMIVKPKLCEWASQVCNYSQLGGYLLNGAGTGIVMILFYLIRN